MLGKTRDDAAGEAFDKVGRVMGLPYPGGAAMDKLASLAFERYDFSKRGALTFPSPAVNDDTFDYSFSGLKTALIEIKDDVLVLSIGETVGDSSWEVIEITEDHVLFKAGEATKRIKR